MSNSSIKSTTDNTISIPNVRSLHSKRLSTEMVQNIHLVWLDANINEGSADCQNTITHLRKVMNTINTFTDGDKCIEFLKEIRDEKVCLVISGSLGKHIVPHIHDMCQVDSIFIFCSNKQYHEQWVKDWSKIKGVYTDIKLIGHALRQSTKDCEQNAIGFSLVTTGDDRPKKNLDQLDPMFMYTQTIKEILLLSKFKQQHILDFMRYNRGTLNKINRSERNYHKQTPKWWYTWESFLYPMLNRALRLSDIDVIVKTGSFIGDLHRQIDKMERNSRLFRVKLEPTSDNDKDLQVLTKRIREETYPDSKEWDRLDFVLLKLGRPKQTEESVESKKGYLYYRLGRFYYNQADYDEANRLLKKSITIYEKYYANDRNLAASYDNNIGIVYHIMSKYAKSLSCDGNSLSSYHPDLYKSYNNIG